jgi:hypothetical protein
MKEENKKTEQHPHQCRMCGMYEITEAFEICQVCGWEDDFHNEDPDEEGGPNHMSFNQYKNIWENNKTKIMNCDNSKGQLVERIFKEQGGRNNDGTTFVPRSDIKLTFEEKILFEERMSRLKREDTAYQKEKREKKGRIVRSEFPMVGKYKIPLIRKQAIDLDCIDLMGYVKAKVGDKENTHKTLHFATHDWNFETVWTKPEEAMEKLGQYYALCSPDFSIYWDMPRAIQIFNTFRNRWCGAYWQSQGAKVIPTIAWGDESTWDFCFDGVEKGSVVMVTTYFVRYPDRFMAGYNKMLEVINPSAIIVYGDRLPGMKGNIKVVCPYDMQEGIAKLGREEYMRRFFAGEAYPK